MAVLSILSGKGGVGKTLFTAALGTALARSGAKVLLVDGDMGLRNMDLILGLENDCLYNIWDLARGKCFASDAVLPAADNLDFIPAAQNEGWEDVFEASMDTLLEDVLPDYDYVLVDCPAGIGAGVKYAEKISDMAVVVLAPAWASRRNGEKLSQLLPKDMPCRFVLNRFSYHDASQVDFKEMRDSLDEELFGGVIPDSAEAAFLAKEGRIQEYDEKKAFGDSLMCVMNTILHDRDYPETRWEKILKDAKAENKKFADENGPAEDRKPAGLTWDTVRRNWKWRRRR